MTVVNGTGSISGPFGGKPSKAKTSSRPMYLPSIYRYSCQGVFRVSTDTPGSVGTCRGLRSRLEHIMDLDVANRADAIDHFTSTQEEEDVTPLDPAVGPHATPSGGPNVPAQIMQEEKGHANPALIYPVRKNKPNHRKLPVIKPTPSPQDPKQQQEQTEKRVTDQEQEEEDDEETSRVLHESWSAYGSTEVECLQLTDVKTGRTQIVAVAPYNYALVSYRNVDLTDGASVTSVQIGFRQKLMFLLESTHHNSQSYREDDDNEMDAKNVSEHGSKKKHKKKSMETENSVLEDANDKTNPGDVSPHHEMPGGLPTPSLWEQAKKAAAKSSDLGEKTQEFCYKVVDKMSSNASWVYQQLSGREFWYLTAASGKRVIDHMPKTAVALGKTMRQLLGWDDDGDDDGSNNNNPGGGGSRGGGGGGPARF